MVSSRFLSCLLLLFLCSPLWALTAISDEELANVKGQDGLSITLDSPGGIQASQLQWQTDTGSADPACTGSGGVADQQACTVMQSLSLEGAEGNALSTSMTLDVGAANGNPYLALQGAWQPAWFRVAGITLETPTNPGYVDHSFGSVGLYSQGEASLINQGIFNSDSSEARFSFSLDGDLIYRQGDEGAAEMSWGNLVFNNYFSDGVANGHNPAGGTVKVIPEGVVIQAPHTYTDLRFDLMYHPSPQGFDRTGRKPLIHTGWRGGLDNALVRIGSGGVGYDQTNGLYNYDGSRSEGLNILSEWDFASDFSWVLGHAGGDRTRIHFQNWQRLGNASGPMLSMPVILDVLQNGAGPTGLCFGGGFLAGQPVSSNCTGDGGSFHGSIPGTGESALAVLIRDGHLHAYNRTIRGINLETAWNKEYDWSLVYTLGKLDADILFYPEGPNGGKTGLKTDITLMAQSPGYWKAANSTDPEVREKAGKDWQTNTHFLLADTDSNQGAGIINADLLWKARDLSLRVMSPDDAAHSQHHELLGGIWLTTDTLSRYRFRGLLGAGQMDDLQDNKVSAALMDLNLSADQFLFVLSPDENSEDVIGFDALMHFDGNTYLSLAEISSPQSSYRLYDMQGSLAWKEGGISIRSPSNAPDGIPRLTIENELLMGESANFGAGPGDPLVTRVGFGGEEFGRMALPAGNWHNELTVKVPD